MDYYYEKERDPRAYEHFDQETLGAFREWNRRVFAPGRLDKKTKELVAVACTYARALLLSRALSRLQRKASRFIFD